jgi:hypothetical protein
MVCALFRQRGKRRRWGSRLPPHGNWGQQSRAQCRGGAPVSTIAATAQTADRIDYWIGFVGMSFRTATEPIPLKAKASSIQLVTDALGSQQSGSA